MIKPIDIQDDWKHAGDVGGIFKLRALVTIKQIATAVFQSNDIERAQRTYQTLDGKDLEAMAASNDPKLVKGKYFLDCFVKYYDSVCEYNKCVEDGESVNNYSDCKAAEKQMNDDYNSMEFSFDEFIGRNTQHDKFMAPLLK